MKSGIGLLVISSATVGRWRRKFRGGSGGASGMDGAEACSAQERREGRLGAASDVLDCSGVTAGIVPVWTSTKPATSRRRSRRLRGGDGRSNASGARAGAWLSAGSCISVPRTLGKMVYGTYPTVQDPRQTSASTRAVSPRGGPPSTG